MITMHDACRAGTPCHAPRAAVGSECSHVACRPVWPGVRPSETLHTAARALTPQSQTRCRTHLSNHKARCRVTFTELFVDGSVSLLLLYGRNSSKAAGSLHHRSPRKLNRSLSHSSNQAYSVFSSAVWLRTKSACAYLDCRASR
jgi:hypothetical protein